MTKFEEFGLSAELMKGVVELGFTTPTPVQAKVIPMLIKGARDVVALAQTGTGKTAAFGLPLLQLTDAKNPATQALVLCPTRELCVQIAKDLTKMQIDSNVAEADVGGVVEGQSVEFTVDAYPTRTFHGVVKQVRNSPITVNNVVTYDTVIGVTNTDNKLKPGMTANVSIIVAHREDALKIPNVALRFRPPDSAVVFTNAAAVVPTNDLATGKSPRKGKGNRGIRTVYVLTGDDSAPQLKAVQIKTGITDGIFTEVTEGLKEGDKVVSSVAQTDAQNSSSTSGSTPFGGMPRMR